MATKKSPKHPQKDVRTSVRRIIYETDTSGTTPMGRRAQSASTTTILEEFENPETHEISAELSSEEPSHNNQGAAALNWVKGNWEIIASIISLAFVGIVFFTRLDARVEVIGKDVDGMKNSLEKSIAEQIKSSTQIDQLKTSVNRLEDQRMNGKK